MEGAGRAFRLATMTKFFDENLTFPFASAHKVLLLRYEALQDFVLFLVQSTLRKKRASETVMMLVRRKKTFSLSSPKNHTHLSTSTLNLPW